jgi:hypothetical protein
LVSITGISLTSPPHLDRSKITLTLLDMPYRRSGLERPCERREPELAVDHHRKASYHFRHDFQFRA